MTYFLSYLAVAVVVGFMAIRRIAWDESDSYGQQRPDSRDWETGWIFGGIGAAIWPLTLVGLAAWWIWTRVLVPGTRAIGNTSLPKALKNKVMERPKSYSYRSKL